MKKKMERFLAKINKTDAGCWEWTASITPKGYGQFYFDGGMRQAHRVAYTLLRGPIPVGLQIDHLCRNRKCVNPDHLEPVTPKVNTARGITNDWQREKTHCPQGHAYDEQNTYKWRGQRSCRTCRNDAARRHTELKSGIAESV